MFGEYVKQKRLDRNLSLRMFCKILNEDASNWSKIERGKLSPPQDRKKLKKIAAILGIDESSNDWNTLIDTAYVDAGKIPDYLMSDKDIINALPVFFRTIGNEKPTPEELKRFIEKIRKER